MKTVIRGSWPKDEKEPVVVVKPTKHHDKLAQAIPIKLAARPFVPADRHSNIRGKSKYAEHIKQIMAHPLGTHCMEFATKGQGKSFVHALCRYLQQKKQYDKIRPALQQIGEVTCVWVVPYEKEV